MATKSTTSKKKTAPKKTDAKKTSAKKSVRDEDDEDELASDMDDEESMDDEDQDDSDDEDQDEGEDGVAAAGPKSGGVAVRMGNGDGPVIMADPDAKLTPAQLKQLYEKLIIERNRAIEGVKRHVGEAVEDQDRLPDDVDLASRHADQAFLLRFADKEHKLLRQINLALSKLENGEYGVCEGTGEPIGFARLKIRPWTRYSVQYKEELERRRAHEKR